MTTEKQNGPNADTKPQAFILAGGKSLRFGADKARVKYNTSTMLQEIAVSLEKAGFQISISTSHKTHQSFGYPIAWDKGPFLGPLHALSGILDGLKQDRIFLIACDTPLIKPDLARWLWQISEGFDITILEDDLGNPSPLPGIYSHRILPTIRANLSKGEASLKSLLRMDLKINIVPRMDWQPMDTSGQSLVNINTMEDLIDGSRRL